MFALTQEQLEQLSVADIKDLRVRIDNAMKENDENMLAAEANRNKALREIGNHLHESVPISNDEVSYLSSVLFDLPLIILLKLAVLLSHCFSYDLGETQCVYIHIYVYYF